MFEPGKSLSLSDIVNVGAKAKEEMKKQSGDGLVVGDKVSSESINAAIG